jgi:hypothetical protein
MANLNISAHIPKLMLNLASMLLIFMKEINTLFETEIQYFTSCNTNYAWYVSKTIYFKNLKSSCSSYGIISYLYVYNKFICFNFGLVQKYGYTYNKVYE